jgi:hypothetical protein
MKNHDTSLQQLYDSNTPIGPLSVVDKENSAALIRPGILL